MQPEPTQAPLWGPMDPETAATVDVVDADWRRDRDRERIDDAIRRVAMANAGLVDPNRVRKLLSGPNGLEVNPRALSARYAGLTKTGVLRVIPGEYVISDDTAGGNAGKPLRLRRWAA
jgi:hypothetical protein